MFAKLYFGTGNIDKTTVNKMQLPEDIWTFKFQLTNAMPALHDNDVTVILVIMIFQTVIEVVY